jgi:hypothetical protein
MHFLGLPKKLLLEVIHFLLDNIDSIALANAFLQYKEDAIRLLDMDRPRFRL